MSVRPVRLALVFHYREKIADRLLVWPFPEYGHENCLSGVCTLHAHKLDMENKNWVSRRACEQEECYEQAVQPGLVCDAFKRLSATCGHHEDG